MYGLFFVNWIAHSLLIHFSIEKDLKKAVGVSGDF